MANYNASSKYHLGPAVQPKAVLRCLSGGYLPMGSNQINTQSAVIQILPLAIPNVLNNTSTGMAVVWLDSNHRKQATAYQIPNTSELRHSVISQLDTPGLGCQIPKKSDKNQKCCHVYYE